MKKIVSLILTFSTLVCLGQSKKEQIITLNNMVDSLQIALSSEKESKLIGEKRYALKISSLDSQNKELISVNDNLSKEKYSLQEKKIGYDIIVPSIIKKFATDKGNANKELMYEQFCKDTKTDLMKTFDMQTLSNPITDIVDAYYIARCGYESTKGK